MPIPGSLSLKLTPTPPGSCLGSHWPVLPPISTIQGTNNTLSTHRLLTASHILLPAHSYCSIAHNIAGHQPIDKDAI